MQFKNSKATLAWPKRTEVNDPLPPDDPFAFFPGFPAQPLKAGRSLIAQLWL